MSMASSGVRGPWTVVRRPGSGKAGRRRWVEVETTSWSLPFHPAASTDSAGPRSSAPGPRTTDHEARETDDNPMMPNVARYAWAVLAYNVAVILWGAYVRATGSGAGCGAHWPLCNGEVVPRAASVATLIEFSHRATSGLALLAVAALVIATFRTCRAGHPARAGAVMSGVLILSEAAVGAGLVLFQLVADNATMARA